MARHRSPRIAPSGRSTPDLGPAAAGALAVPARRRGAHRLRPPSAAVRGRVVVAAVAAGAIAASSPTWQALTGGVRPDAGTGARADVAPLAFSSPGGSVQEAAAPTPEVLVAAVRGPSADVAALDRVVTRAEDIARSVAEAARLAAEEAARPKYGVPYEAGNDEDLDGWIAQALGLMGLPQALAPGVKEIVLAESNGDPDAINLWDSNAAAGRPSQGLMQTIPTTFEACVLPSLADRDITDPVANITAGVRNMIANHGVATLLQGGRKDASGNYIGYGGGSCDVDYDELADELLPLF